MIIPPSAPPEIQRAFQELLEKIEALEARDHKDMHGSRLGNTGTPIAPRDYANKGYVDGAVTAAIGKVLERVGGIARKAFSLVGGGSTTPPSSGAAIDFGYYRVDTSAGVGGGQFGSEVRDYTNICYVGPVDGGPSSTSPSDRQANLLSILGRLTGLGFSVILDVELGGSLTVGAVLQAARPYWDKVKYVNLADEPDPGEVDLNAEIQLLKNRINNLGLPMRPIGVVFTQNQVLSHDMGALNFDFIGIEAYTPQCSCGSCGPGSPQAEAQAVAQVVQQMKAVIPATKFLMVVMQGYDRNGAFTNTPALIEINRQTYFQMVKGDARVKAVTIFSYAREGNGCGTGSSFGFGSRGYPQLKSVHQEIWRDISGGFDSAGAKKCSTDSRNCPGPPTCCDGGVGNPCECPRLCTGGIWAPQVDAANSAATAAHPGLFTGGILNSETAANQWTDFLVVEFNSSNQSLKAIHDPNDGKQVLVRLRTSPQFREDYRVWNSNLTTARSPGSYRATCWGVDLGF